MYISLYRQTHLSGGESSAAGAAAFYLQHPAPVHPEAAGGSGYFA